MIALFTDFHPNDPYVGQMHVVLAQQAPGISVIDLFHNLPAYNVKAAAYLLPAYCAQLPEDCVVLAVVDPGVGGSRQAVMLRVDKRWYVGPDNGLFELIRRRAKDLAMHRIDWRPERISDSFHGRDLFAPVAAQLATAHIPESTISELQYDAADWPDDWPTVIYIDHYGNAITGLRINRLNKEMAIVVNGISIHYARTFGEVGSGECFWYVNANGLVEIACNQDSAARTLALNIGQAISVPQAKQ
ncbi:MAG: SAM-dependent chlorinase/fluorinase [Gammaproteobacteria bacterium]|nr:MAG: SAM-dependent chlorinase/fluorinase [Gammaproteobacteria bacterium]